MRCSYSHTGEASISLPDARGSSLAVLSIWHLSPRFSESCPVTPLAATANNRCIPYFHSVLHRGHQIPTILSATAGEYACLYSTFVLNLLSKLHELTTLPSRDLMIDPGNRRMYQLDESSATCAAQQSRRLTFSGASSISLLKRNGLPLMASLRMFSQLPFCDASKTKGGPA